MKYIYILIILFNCSILHGIIIPEDSLIFQKPFDKVVLWGHKLHTHTHSWIHWAFHRAFKDLGYTVYWLDNNDNVSNIDFSNALFITEGQVDQRMPLRKDCRYILHNCNNKRYKDLYNNGNVIILQVYICKYEKNDVKKIDDCSFIDQKNKIIYMPWATDLLPHEIDAIKEQLPKIKKQKVVCWIGTIGGQKFGNIEQINPFKKACSELGISFRHYFYVSMKNNISYIQRSIIAPTIVGKWQFDEGYIPCRIFKNISYGQMGVTNSKVIYDLFKGKIVYNPDTYQLCYDALNKIKHMDIQELYDLMNFVRDHHTYLNRIHHLFNFMHSIKPLI